MKKKSVSETLSKPKTTPVTPNPTTPKVTQPTPSPTNSILTALQRNVNIPTIGSPGRTNSSTGKITPLNTSPKPTASPPVYGIGNPQPGYSDDDYRTPMYGQTPTGMASPNVPVAQATTPQAPTQSPFDMSQFTGMFDKYNESNMSRFSALEKMIQDLLNGNKYNQAQQGQQAVSGTNAVYDGTHQFTAPNQGKNIGYTQNNDAMNQTLYKYLNGMWKGGF